MRRNNEERGFCFAKSELSAITAFAPRSVVLNRPLFEYNRQTDSQGLPVIAGITPILRGIHTLTTLSQNQIISAVVPALRSLVIEMAQTFRPSWTRSEAESRLSGVLLVTNLNTLSTHSSGTAVDFSDMTFELFFQIFDRITQSNNEISLYDIEFKFAFNPNSFSSGAGALTFPKNTPQAERKYWIDHEFISCACIAITASILPRSSRFNDVLTAAYELQQELGWDKEVELQQFQEYVEKYQSKRLVILALGSNTLMTFQHSSFTYNRSTDNLYIVFDLTQGHYAPCMGSAEKWLRLLYNDNNVKLCPDCAVMFRRSISHSCSTVQFKKIRYSSKVQKCRRCEKYGEHDCLEKSCMRCKELLGNAPIPTKDSQHRCPVIDDFKFKEFYKSGPLDGKTPALFAYDCESAIAQKPSVNGQARITNFVRDESGRFTGEAEYDSVEYYHRPTLVCVQGVHHDFKKKFAGTNAFFEFVQFMKVYNKGNNYLYAHNAKGYDSQLLLLELKEWVRGKGNQPSKDIVSLTRTGSKIMELKIGKLVFRDSMCHVPGSLAALAKNFCESSEMRKGDFPHLFHTLDRFNENYIGPIPPLEMFTPKIKTAQDLQEFKTWHSQRAADPTPWNFRQELEAYCENDVFLLTKIMQGFESPLLEIYGASPFVKRTTPGAAHAAFLSQMFCNEIDLESYPDDQKYSQLQLHVKTKTWPILRAEEHFFARKALHGGRTEIHTLYRSLTPAEKETCVIKMFDVVSMYPAIQATQLLPVGIPIIHVYDTEYAPCYIHRNVEPYTHCTCPTTDRSRSLNFNYETEPTQTQLEQMLADPSRGGILEVKIQPPTTLRHPVLCVSKFNKLIFDCEEIDRGCFPHISILAALRYGYKILKIYRWDEYYMTTPLWRDFTLRLYLRKMINSRTTPTGDEASRLLQTYESMFPDTEFITELENSILNQTWRKDAAAKQCAKINVNCGWGKACQNTNMGKDDILDTVGENNLWANLWHELESNQIEIKNVQQINDNSVLVKTTKHVKHGEQNLSKVYVPAALYVPAYGQLQILEMMNHPALVEVLMNDTDSVCGVFKKDQVPQGSDILGEWEDEGFEVEEFLAIAPKMYFMKLTNGKYKLASKGVSLGYDTENIFNYEIVKRHILETLITNQASPLLIPQQTFLFDFDRGMRTHKFFKQIKVRASDLKGELDFSNGRIYPFGYTGQRHDPIDFQSILDETQ